MNGGSRMHDAPRSAEHGVQRLGREWLFAFYTALRSIRLYPLENQAVQNALHELEVASAGLFRAEGAIEMRHVGDFFFVNDLRLRPDLASYATFGAVGRAFGRYGVGSLEVDSGAEMWEWTTLLSLLVADPSAEKPFAALEAGLARAGVRHLHPGGETDDVPEPPDVNLAREAAKRTYAETVSVAREVMTGARIGKGVNLRRVKRAVQSIVDQVLTNETSITGMTVLRDYDEYTFTHSVNVCIFSIALGKRLALSKPQLYELGLGALMHDIGKVTLPLEVMNKAGPLDEAEWEMMREHPAEGLLSLFGMRGFAELPLRAMLMAYEHHMKLDLSGYPRCKRPRSPTLFSRIVSIADSFDAATTKRSYQAQPFPPDQVLREMSQNPARGLDPLLVRAFISTTGFYPLGTLVILDSYELAVVVAQDPRPEALHQPVVRIIYDEMGNPIEPPRTVELSETDPATGAPRRAIIKTTDPERYGINVGDLFL